MESKAHRRIALAFARETHRSPTARLCNACVEVLDVSGAGITLMGGSHSGPICVSDAHVAVLEDLQFTMGEGPCQDAFRSRLPVLAPELEAAGNRWPAFVDAAQRSGVGAAFAYPLSAGPSLVGVLTLYQDVPGPLSAGQEEDSIMVAGVLAETVLTMQDDAVAGELAPGFDWAVAYRAQIYQASGMVAVQLGVSAHEGLLLMRAHSFSSGRSLSDVADDILARRLLLEDT